MEHPADFTLRTRQFLYKKTTFRLKLWLKMNIRTPCPIYGFVLNIMEHPVQYMGLDKRVWHSSITFSKLLNQGFQEFKKFVDFIIFLPGIYYRYPCRKLVGYPCRTLEGYPCRILYRYPCRILYRYPCRILDRYPCRILVRYSCRILVRYPCRISLYCNGISL